MPKPLIITEAVELPEDHAPSSARPSLAVVQALVASLKGRLVIILRAREGVILTGTVTAAVVVMKHLRVGLQQVIELGLTFPAAGRDTDPVHGVDEAGVPVHPVQLLRGRHAARLLLLSPVLVSPGPGRAVEVRARAVSQLRQRRAETAAAVATLLGLQQSRLQGLLAAVVLILMTELETQSLSLGECRLQGVRKLAVNGNVSG